MRSTVKEVPVMNEEQFKEYIQTNNKQGLKLVDYSCVSKYKSIKRAIKRLHVTEYGQLIPKRPFNNRANTSTRSGIHSRVMNEIKRGIYYGINN